MAKSLILQVSNLPENRLAFTNKAYLSPSNFSSLVASQGTSSSALLISVGDSAFVAEGHNSVASGQIALNGLQRRYLRLSLKAKLEVKPYVPPPNSVLASLEMSVDLLAKRTPPGKVQARQIDTERLAEDVIRNYEEHVFSVGQTIAMDFEGNKMELAITKLGFVGENVNGTGDIAGQLFKPTELVFRKAKGSQLVELTGNKISGGSSGGTSIFLSDFDFEKLGIGGLDAEFNQIFRRAFASRIWPAHIVKQMGINHVRGMLLYGPPGCGE